MLKIWLLFILSFQIAISASAEVVGAADVSHEAPADFIATCVNVCTQVAQTNTSASRELFQKNCQSARRDADEISTLIGAAQRTGSIMMQFTYRCGPQAIKKAGEGLVNAVIGLPALIANAFTIDPLTQAQREARQKLLDECSRTPVCMRATARQLLRFQQKNSDGTFTVPDSEVDSYLAEKNARSVQLDVMNEVSRLKSHCNTQYNFFSSGVHAANPGDVTLAMRREIYNRLAADSPYCPNILNLPPPEWDPAALPARTSAPITSATIDRLSLVEKIYVGYGCLGDKFTDAMWDACAEGMQYLVPIPVVEAASLALNGIRAARAAAASPRVAAVLNNLPVGHTPISVLPDGVLTRTVTDGKISYQVVKPGGVIDRQRMDPSGYALSASNDTSRQLAYSEIASGGKSVMFFDVNHLGLVNYYRNGAQSGDEYLGNVARILAEKVGPNGTVYRWGGDEFMVVYNSTDRAGVQSLAQNISDTVISDPTTRRLFRAEREANAADFRAVMASSSYDSLPASFTSSLSDAERAFAQSDFAQFKTIFRSVETQRFYDSAAIQPSVSVGTSGFTSGQQSAQDIVALANQGANICKIGYKTAVGLNVCKYTGRETYLPAQPGNTVPRHLRSRPEVVPNY